MKFLPNKLLKLTLYGSFNSDINDIPSTVREITLGARFNKEIKNLPNGLKKLIFHAMCNYSHDLLNLPESLTALYLPTRYNKTVNYPKGLMKLRTQHVLTNLMPNLRTYANYSLIGSQSRQYTLPQTLTKLKIFRISQNNITINGYDFCFFLSQLDSLTALDIMTLDQNICECLPKNLKKLTVNDIVTEKPTVPISFKVKTLVCTRYQERDDHYYFPSDFEIIKLRFTKEDDEKLKRAIPFANERIVKRVVMKKIYGSLFDETELTDNKNYYFDYYVKEIKFNDHCCEDISKIITPSLNKIHFGPGFNEYISTPFPDTIKEITFGKKFSHDISNIIPKKLSLLRINKRMAESLSLHNNIYCLEIILEDGRIEKMFPYSNNKHQQTPIDTD